MNDGSRGEGGAYLPSASGMRVYVSRVPSVSRISVFLLRRSMVEVAVKREELPFPMLFPVRVRRLPSSCQLW